MSTAFKNWYNSKIAFTEFERFLLYQAIATQIKAGRSPMQAFETLTDTFKLSDAITKIARAAVSAASEGKLTIEGAAATGFLPKTETSLLRLAEMNNSLPAACEQILGKTKEKLSFLQAVILPNAYYLTVLLALLFISTQATDFITLLPATPAALQQLPVYIWSTFLQSWWPIMLILTTSYILLLLYGRSSFTGIARQMLFIFDIEYQNLLTIRVAELGELLYSQGATHDKFLVGVIEAYGQELYVRRGAANARNSIAEGLNLEKALAGQLITGQAAAVLESLVPGNNPTLYPTAFRTIIALQKTQLQKLYWKANYTIKLLTLACIGAIVLMIVQGMITAVSAF